MSKKTLFKKIWNFLWYEESVLSWIANIIVAFILIKFIIYPLISLLLSTPLPIVAVVSGSMEHKFAPVCDQYLKNGLCLSYSDTRFDLCGKSDSKKSTVSQDDYWKTCGIWYESKNITSAEFSNFSFSSGFNTGDVMFVRGKPWNTIQVGEVVVWFAKDGTPIIHRVVRTQLINATRYLETKGDHNFDQIQFGQRSELQIPQSRYVGVAVLRVPWLGHVKLQAVRFIGYLASLF